MTCSKPKMQSITNLTRTAILSPCATYRYLLTRSWDISLPSLLIIMLNPSSATSNADDPTTRRCVGFARRHSRGLGGIRVVNLLAFRSPSPALLRRALDPVGADNADVVARELRASGGKEVLVAWGRGGEKFPAARFMTAWVVGMADLLAVKLVCLGRTGGGRGAPRHPLYVKADEPFRDFVAYGPLTSVTGGPGAGRISRA